MIKFKYKNNVNLIVLVLIILCISIAILRLTKNDTAQKIQKEITLPVNTKKIVLRSLSPQYIFYGHIEGKNEIDLVANLDGKIKKVSKKLSDSSKVIKDEVLFELDPFEYEQDVIEKKSILNDLNIKLKKTKFLMQETKEQLIIAEKGYQRKMKLLGNTVSKKALDESKLNLSKAKSNFSNEQFRINSIEANLKKAMAQLEISKKNLSNTKYRAPFSGKIANNLIDIGSEVLRGKLLAKIVNTDLLEVKFFVGETSFMELGNIDDIKGKEIKVFWNKSKYRNNYVANITKIDSIIDQQLAGLNMYAGLEKIDKKDPIRPGAFVEIIVEGNKFDNSILIPEQALYEDSYIYLLEEKKPRKLKVKNRGNIGNEILVTGKLNNNNLVIITRLENIKEEQNFYSYNK